MSRKKDRKRNRKRKHPFTLVVTGSVTVAVTLATVTGGQHAANVLPHNPARCVVVRISTP
jgi:hypothetical protein